MSENTETQEFSAKFKYGLAEITVNVRFEGHDYEELKFVHPTTGQEQETYHQCMVGWSEQSKEDQEEWEKLGEALDKYGEDLAEYVSYHDGETIQLKEGL